MPSHAIQICAGAHASHLGVPGALKSGAHCLVVLGAQVVVQNAGGAAWDGDRATNSIAVKDSREIHASRGETVDLDAWWEGNVNIFLSFFKWRNWSEAL